MTPACVNCKFHQLNPADMNVVLCRRYPPTPFMVPQGPNRVGQMIMYPQLPKGFWCGEYKPTEQFVQLGIAK